jgi:membrane AbrB-like protein
MLKTIDLRGHTVALGIGVCGGALFYFLKMPLAWMLGSMVFVTVAALAGFNPFMNKKFRAVMVTILGVFLGSAFSPEVIDRAGQWALALSVLAGFIVLGSAIGYVFLRRVGGLDQVTAYFAAAPGGLSEMAIASEELGGDVRQVSLIHTIRVITIIMVIPFWFRLVVGADVPSMMPPVEGPDPEWLDWVILFGCGVLGWPLAKLCRLPAASLVGPMILSAIAHLTAMTHLQPPPVPVAAAQVVLGAAVGCRFAGTSLSMLGRVARLALCTTGLLLLLAIGFVYAFSSLIEVEPSAMILVLSPGGLAEMSLIALALGIDTAFVSTMHMCRIMLIIVLGPGLFRLARRWRGETEN